MKREARILLTLIVLLLAWHGFRETRNRNMEFWLVVIPLFGGLLRTLLLPSMPPLRPRRDDIGHEPSRLHK